MNRKFGIELEITGITQSKAAAALRAVGIEVITPGYTHRTTQAWKIVPDSSVNRGFEVVSPILEGESGLDAAEAAINALKAAGAGADRSCGLHVHFDAADLGVEELRSIVSRYAAFENEIDAFMPPSRRGSENRYCRSIRNLVASRAFQAAGGVRELAAAQGGRYYKVNLQSLHRHGTVEFRQHNGIMDADRALNWIKFLDGFIRESVRIAGLPPCSPARNLPPALSAGQRGLVRRLEAGEGNAAALADSLGVLPHTLRAAISRLRRAGVGVRCVHRHGAAFYELDSPVLMRANVNDSLWAGIDNRIAGFYRNRAAVLALAA